MKKIIITCVLLLAANSAALAQACDCETLEGDLTSNKTLFSATCYELSGCYRVTDGYTLTIQAGTKIFAAAGSALYIERGAAIQASGTSMNPIVFTSDQAPNSRDYGDWDGIYIAGEAANNQTGNEITLERSCTIEGGGSTADDNSGVFKYVQVHYSENGLTLVSVGNSTEFNHVQVTHSAANSFSFLGGTVNVSNLVSYNAKENDFFATFGYVGLMQFILGFRQDLNANSSAFSHGLLVTNDATGSSATPLTRPIVSNMTLLGPAYCSSSTLSTNFRDAVRFSANASAGIYNSVLTNWRLYGLYLADAATITNTASDDVNFSYNSFDDNGSGDYNHGTSWSSACAIDMMTWITGDPFDPCTETGNEFSPITTLGYNSGSICTSNSNRDFSLGTTTLSAASFSGIDDLDDPFFDDAVTFRGALGSTDWTDSWSEFAPLAIDYCEEGLMKQQKEQSSLLIVPNPASGLSYAAFTATAPGIATLSILDKIDGRPLLVQTAVVKQAGTQRIAFNVSRLSTGVYLLRLELGKTIFHQQLIVR